MATPTVKTSGVKEQLQKKVNEKPEGPKKESTMADLLQQMLPQIKSACEGIMSPERFTRIALSTFNGNRNFWNCDRKSFLAALMMSAQAGLEPNTILGESYLIPYGGKITFQVGYKGILKLAYRTNEYKAIYAHVVNSNDKFEYCYGLNKQLIHIPADEPNNDPVYYYAVYHLKNGGYDFQVWSHAKVLNHAKQFSKTYNSGPWQTNFDEMAKKTVLLATLKYAPKSVELARAIESDNSIKEDIKENMEDVDNIINDFDYEVEPENNGATGNDQN